MVRHDCKQVSMFSGDLQKWKLKKKDKYTTI